MVSLFDDCELNVSYAVGSNPSKELNAGSTICIERVLSSSLYSTEYPFSLYAGRLAKKVVIEMVFRCLPI